MSEMNARAEWDAARGTFVLTVSRDGRTASGDLGSLEQARAEGWRLRELAKTYRAHRPVEVAGVELTFDGRDSLLKFGRYLTGEKA